MTRSRVLFFLLSALLVFPMLAGTLLLAADRGRRPDSKIDKKDDSLYKYLGVFSEVLGLIRQTYVDEPDMDALMTGALEGATDALDPFSYYVPASQVDRYLQASATGQRLSGLVLLKEHGIAYVVSVQKGSPADAAGVRAGDIFAKVGTRQTRTMPLWEMHETLAAKAGTSVTIELIRLGAPVTATFVLQPFTMPPPALQEVEGATLLRIPSFDAETAGQVRLALGQAGKQAHGKLLIDLRAVSWGDPEAAYATAKLFTGGSLGTLSRRKEVLQSFAGNEPPAWQGKLVLVVDRSTLGPAEIFATILHQELKADLVGERTFGHAGRQGTAVMSSGGRLFFTDAFYTGPDGHLLNEGLKPDLLVNERSRTYLEKDVPMTELILRRAVHRLLGDQAIAKTLKAPA
ncbi:MAG: S41 family peptidase [Acidobacteriota bacterium]|nr:S41 family peptidase [Acidobacteriota bacterium]